MPGRFVLAFLAVSYKCSANWLWWFDGFGCHWQPFAGIELVSETTEEERTSVEGVKPDLVQGIEFAYTLPVADLVVMLLLYFLFYTHGGSTSHGNWYHKMTSFHLCKSYFQSRHAVMWLVIELRSIWIIIIISKTMFMVLSSWQSHCESSPGSSDECRMAPSGRRPKTKPDDLGC